MYASRVYINQIFFLGDDYFELSQFNHNSIKNSELQTKHGRGKIYFSPKNILDKVISS